MKMFPLTDEVCEEVARLNSAVGVLNGTPLSREDTIATAHFLSEVKRFADFGNEGTCPAALYHGPGHQSRCGCELEPGHEGAHTGLAQHVTVRWSGLVSFSGYFDELPDED